MGRPTTKLNEKESHPGVHTAVQLPLETGSIACFSYFIRILKYFTVALLLRLTTMTSKRFLAYKPHFSCEI